MRHLDKAARDALKRRRRKLIISSLEVMLGDLVAIDGIEATKEVLEKFMDQLEMNS